MPLGQPARRALRGSALLHRKHTGLTHGAIPLLASHCCGIVPAVFHGLLEMATRCLSPVHAWQGVAPQINNGWVKSEASWFEVFWENRDEGSRHPAFPVRTLLCVISVRMDAHVAKVRFFRHSATAQFTFCAA
jgi:hypothetical protein